MRGSVSIHLDRDSPTPLYQQIAQALQNRIHTGELPAGSKLPAIRVLARSLGVNSITVVKAYQELERAGLAVSRAGSGTYVAPVWEGEPVPAPLADRAGLADLDQGQVEVPAGAVNFASATPDPDLLPVTMIQHLINRVIERDGGHAFAYEDARGYPPLRAAVAASLERLGIPTDADAVQVLSGGQQGIDVVAKSLLNAGDAVVVEEPTYPGALAVFRSRGAHLLSVPVETDGPDLTALEQLLATNQPRFLYLMPAFQNPTGVVYSRAKKERLLELAARFRLTILEDDYLRELSFAPTVDLTPLAALAPPAVPVLYLLSFSKVLLPGLRLAFLVAPPALGREIRAAKHTSDIFTSGLFQRVFDLFLREGNWEQQLHEIRRRYQERYLALRDALAAGLPPEVTFTPPPGGLNFWLRLPDGHDSLALYRAALAEGVVIAPGAAFSAAARPSPYFRLTYASLSVEEIRRGVTLLTTALHRLLDRKKEPNYTPFV